MPPQIDSCPKWVVMGLPTMNEVVLTRLPNVGSGTRNYYVSPYVLLHPGILLANILGFFEMRSTTTG